ncbi:MAG: oligosaccharide flippase family protein [Gammaproteobacteria bacterium]|nr:oligosaccharide flippase family protein [Gammaproteobacteria bacterium]
MLKINSAFFKVFIGGVVAAGFGFLSSVILARTMSVEDFGRISLIITLSIISFTMLEFGLGNALVVYVNKRGSGLNRFGVFKTILMKYIPVFFLLSIFLVVLYKIIYSLSWLEVIVVFLSSCCFFLHKILLSVNQANGDWTRFNILQSGNTFIKFVCLLLGFALIYLLGETNWLYDSYLYALIVYGITIVLVGIFVSEIRAYKSERVPKAEHSEIRSIVIPIGLANILIIIALRFDLLLVAYFLSEKSVGLYHAANTLAMVFPLVTKALMSIALRESAVSERLSFLNSLKNQNKLIPFLIITAVLVAFSSNILVKLVYGANYEDASTLFVLLTIGYIGGIYFIPLESYFYSHNQSNLLKSKLCVAVVMLSLGFILVTQIQEVGVAVAVVTSKVVGWCVIGFMVLREIKLGKVDEKQFS